MKEYLKIFIGKFLNWHNRSSQKKDIFLFAGRRSGSTWIMEVIASQPGIKYSDQPPNWKMHKRYLSKINSDPFEITSLTERESEVLCQYFTDLVNDEIQVSPPWNIFEETYSFITNRYVLKITDALAILPWFVSRFDANFVYFIRHPIPTSQSIDNLGWDPTVTAFLEDEAYLQKNFDSEQIDFAKRINSEGSTLEKLTLEWALKNFIPLNYIFKEHGKELLVMSYEELVLNHEKSIGLLSRNLDLPEVEKLEESIQKPSSNARGRSRREIREREQDYMVTKWSDKVTQREKRKVDKILSVYNLDRFYKAEKFLPKDALINFSETKKMLNN